MDICHFEAYDHWLYGRVYSNNCRKASFYMLILVNIEKTENKEILYLEIAEGEVV